MLRVSHLNKAWRSARFAAVVCALAVIAIVALALVAATTDASAARFGINLSIAAISLGTATLLCWCAFTEIASPARRLFERIALIEAAEAARA